MLSRRGIRRGIRIVQCTSLLICGLDMYTVQILWKQALTKDGKAAENTSIALDYCAEYDQYPSRWCLHYKFIRDRTFKKLMFKHLAFFHLRLCISQFHLRPAPAPPPPGYCGAFVCLVSPGGGAFANLHCPGVGHLPTSGQFPSFWHARGFLSEYNYTEGFTGKNADLLILQGQE